MSDELTSLVESLLFVSVKPLTARKIADLSGASVGAVERSLSALGESYRLRGGGVMLSQSGGEYQLVTAPENARQVQAFLRDEMTGELTRPSLEALTIIAYRGPVTKAEIEQIRGVNCSLILRNLLIRGLIEAEEDKRTMTTRYRVTLDFLRFLGKRDATELPDYQKLRGDRALAEILATTTDSQAAGEHDGAAGQAPTIGSRQVGGIEMV